MKTSIADAWGKASNEQRKINEATSDCLREATTACLDLLVQAQHTTGIHRVCAVGGFKDTGLGYSSEIRWSEKGDYWWTPQRKLLLTSSHGNGYVHASGGVYMPTTGMRTDELVDALAAGLAVKYIR